MIKNTVVVWYEVQKILDDSPGLFCFSPIWGKEHLLRSEEFDGGSGRIT